MLGLSGYIEYDQEGRPYIGLLLTADEGISVSYYLAHKGQARVRIAAMMEQFERLVTELEATPDKLIAVKGNLDGLHDQPGRKLPTHPQGRSVQRTRRPRS